MSEIEIIRDVATHLGGEVREHYSGKQMYGLTCPGIVCASFQDCVEEAASRGLRGAVVDHMGLQYIVYWPKLRSEVKDAR